MTRAPPIIKFMLRFMPHLMQPVIIVVLFKFSNLRIIICVGLFMQIDCWLSAINGGYNYGDLLRDSSPYIKAGEKDRNSAESDAAFLERFAQCECRPNVFYSFSGFGYVQDW